MYVIERFVVFILSRVCYVIYIAVSYHTQAINAFEVYTQQ